MTCAEGTGELSRCPSAPGCLKACSLP
jgi:hypothetical protein